MLSERTTPSDQYSSNASANARACSSASVASGHRPTRSSSIPRFASGTLARLNWLWRRAAAMAVRRTDRASSGRSRWISASPRIPSSEWPRPGLGRRWAQQVQDARRVALDDQGGGHPGAGQGSLQVAAELESALRQAAGFLRLGADEGELAEDDRRSGLSVRVVGLAGGAGQDGRLRRVAAQPRDARQQEVTGTHPAASAGRRGFGSRSTGNPTGQRGVGHLQEQRPTFGRVRRQSRGVADPAGGVEELALGGPVAVRRRGRDRASSSSGPGAQATS